ncbi:MAG: MBL fold metallo-hydrolase RNA specificity domain-containing protein [Anaerolineae bacterium]
MRLQFWGAAREVTGSMHLLQANGYSILLDCGLFQGKRQNAFDRNRDMPFEGSSIDAVVLSHAHIDHSGNLPSLYKSGFRGPIWSTSATRDVCAHTLLDSAYIQESDVMYVNKRRLRQGKNPFEPLYTQEDALDTMRLFRSVEVDAPFEVVPGVDVHFREAGHILGAAIVVLDIDEGGRKRRLLFSGDVGRDGLAILRDPETAPDVDFLIMESTYGGRLHESTDGAREALLELVRSTCVERRAKLLIPAFALGRTQEIVYHLNRMHESGELPKVDIYVNSPLAVNLTDVFRLHPECYDAEYRLAMMTERDRDPLDFDGLHYVRSVQGSKELNELVSPAVIISASGMCEGGRILHHLAAYIEDPKNTVLFVGFQAEHTLGRRLVDGASPVRIYGKEYDVRAQIEQVEGYSAHADHDGLVSWASQVRDSGQLKRVFLVHGEEEAMVALAAGLTAEGIVEPEMPVRGQAFKL